LSTLDLLIKAKQAVPNNDRTFYMMQRNLDNLKDQMPFDGAISPGGLLKIKSSFVVGKLMEF
jgi:hypothetical protein